MRFQSLVDPAIRRRRAKELAKNDYRLLRDLIRIREKRGLSQKQIADSLGISQQAVSKFEQLDADPRLSTIRQYAHAVGALVAHAVVMDEGQLSEGQDWQVRSFVVTRAGHRSDNSASYVTRAPKRTDFAMVA